MLTLVCTFHVGVFQGSIHYRQNNSHEFFLKESTTQAAVTEEVWFYGGAIRMFECKYCLEQQLMSLFPNCGRFLIHGSYHTLCQLGMGKLFGISLALDHICTEVNIGQIFFLILILKSERKHLFKHVVSLIIIESEKILILCGISFV